MRRRNNLTRSKIIDAAENVIIEGGLEALTISRIAEKAGIADSLAYKYFNGKDDIIFSVVAERTKEEIALIQERLGGITDQRLKLREVIGHMLKYNDTHRNHVKNLLFQCRSKKIFYKSDAYPLIQKYESIILDILRQGVLEGVFRNDIDMKFIVNMIFGTIDVEALDTVFGDESEESIHDLDHIMSLLFPVLAKRQKPVSTDRKQSIMNAASAIFAKEGFAYAKIASIAKLAGVAEGAIYDYFASKEELLFAISDRYLNSYLRKMSNTFKPGAAFSLSPTRKLWVLMSSFCLTFLSDQDYMEIYFMNIFFNSRHHERYYKSDRPKSLPNSNEFNKIFDNIILEGKRDGSFRDDVDPRTFRFMFMGSYTHLVLRWIIIEHREFDKYTEIRNMLFLLLTAVLKEPADLKHFIKVAFQ